MDGKMLARLGAVVFVGVAITTTVIEVTRRDEAAPVPTAAAPERGAPDTLRPLLRRCRDMGEAAIHDRTCLRAWAENRDRFLKQRPAASAESAPVADQAEDPIRKESMPADALVPPEAR